MQKLLLNTLLAASALFLPAQSKKDCLCKPTEQHGYGGHETISIKDDKIYRRLSGFVTDLTTAPLPGAIVEVLIAPEQDGGDGRKRIAACVVGESGQFCFPEMKPGRYRLSVSAQGFKVTGINLRLNPRSRKSTKEDLIVILEVGT